MTAPASVTVKVERLRSILNNHDWNTVVRRSDWTPYWLRKRGLRAVDFVEEEIDNDMFVAGDYIANGNVYPAAHVRLTFIDDYHAAEFAIRFA